ncbi:Gamma-tubulin complex component 5 [Pseudolycoriella hygida]|uniref:Gamma-tubulin complex component n=1 Tax=Pseudolycoriella hygida TaxID=35572 RepID=A0A9Q0MPV4_9DIPT|nr:Gamma-tubulin complex component 5 [Pseudolycoriella hygida]
MKLFCDNIEMSFREVREQIISENVPKLVNSILGINETDPNFKIAVDFTLSNIINTKYASVNSNEIRRQISGLGERFEISNFKQHGDRLKELCKSFCEHPVCKDHPETDIAWRILRFLLNTARNPIEGAIRNKDKINVEPSKEDEALECGDREEVHKTSFVEQEFSDSDLSVWSDDDEEDQQEEPEKAPTPPSAMDEFDKKINAMFPGIKPPQKPDPFTYMETDKSKIRSFLYANVQHSWWNDPNYIYPCVSDVKDANWCHFWNAHTDNVKISTISEYCLIREILFMFIVPTNCKFFRIENDTIEINDFVSLNSVSLPVIQSFLSGYTEPMTFIHRMRTFCESVYRSKEKRAPHTYECFAEGIRRCLEPFETFILAKERQVLEPEQLVRPLTIARLFNQMNHEYFEKINYLYQIYQRVTLDFKQYSSHTCTAYLICALLQEVRSASNGTKSHLAMTLFLMSIETCLRITDIWWTEGRLEDWRNEYFVQRTTRDTDLVDEYKLRNYDELDPTLASVIHNCRFLKIWQKFALEAAFTVSTLYKMNRMLRVREHFANEGKYVCEKIRIDSFNTSIPENLYKTFVNSLFEMLPRSYRTPAPLSKIERESQPEPFKKATYSLESIDRFRKELAGNQFLFLYEPQLKKMENDAKGVVDEVKLKAKAERDFFERLKPRSTFILPYHQFIYTVSTNVFSARISIAHKYVLEIYKNEHQLLHHLQVLPKVYFMDAGDLMFDFYSKLFTQIENSNSWNNPFILTSQLNEIVSYRISNSSFPFRVQITTKTCIRDVILAIDEISLNYVGNEHLYNVITEESIQKYNKAILSHFMTTVLHFMSGELKTKIDRAKNLNEIINIHSHYINKISDLCFQTKENEKICQGITQLLCLVSIVRDEWHCVQSSSDELDGSSVNDEICSLEKTYINCHAFLADTLLTEVYRNNNSGIDGLSDAFNCSRPAKENNICLMIKLLCLVSIVRDEWHCVQSSSDELDGSSVNDEICSLEKTYINCHAFLADTLLTEVYRNNNSGIDGLSDAFNCSRPY